MSSVAVNQVGHLPSGPKRATLVTDATGPLPWELADSAGRVVATGTTDPRGIDISSQQNVHTIDFGAHRQTGAGFTLTADGATSRPFTIAPGLYDTLRADALRFFYCQRSGIEIRDDLRPGYGRPAGHLGDRDVPCAPDAGDYRLDVRGGWYDAGDQGKYVVNGGITVWQLLHAFEHRGGLDALTLDLPESGNGLPDLLNEVRWELDFLLRMQAPSGLVHHKMHDREWTGLPTLPHLNAQPRELRPISTAATLNLAAVAAQGARIFRKYDADYAERLLAAARAAHTAAETNPIRYAPVEDTVGGGPYNDDDVRDEFYWAAAELFLTTGEHRYAEAVLTSPLHTEDVFGPYAFDWAATAAAARLSLALTPSELPGLAEVRASVLAGADRYLTLQQAHPYAIAYAPPGNRWEWGSNSMVLNNLMVLAVAHDLTGETRYRDGVLEGLDYILGRNALNLSYVTGYGTDFAQNQHSRWYAHQLDPSLPHPPKGTLAGGPNSGLQDEVAQARLTGRVGQFCYIDDIHSWSTNELTINWNAPLAWIAAFAAELG
ncbi:endoglucanase [Actinoplanes campanulatus]|uniref:Endoglucanase n=1 Tax=Actinoplanes campanulatus TaxID=113559 RepID=A0A7W5AQ84_9ACTN|nr:glycoside hydrolase family 9 protein [Actinoplanes campanulatus]MBB3100250.1 endoglucanase [Actinoplanes campanulatus]GGN44214.1 endoglucanase [Actinoplanes campanulatus]GID40947.1 endoglucanase [Actinoplanes campanulatus]